MSTGQASTGGGDLILAGTYDVGSVPTLLESFEAKKVKALISSFVLNSTYKVSSGAEESNRLAIRFEDGGIIWEIGINTAVVWSLTDDLILNGYDIVANKSGSIFAQYGDEGLVVGSRGGIDGRIKLTNQSNPGGAGFQYGGGDTVWKLPSTDHVGDAILLSSINEELDWSAVVKKPLSNEISVGLVGRDFEVGFVGYLKVAGDSGSANIDLPGNPMETLTIAGGTDISTAVSGNTLTIDYTGTGGSAPYVYLNNTIPATGSIGTSPVPNHLDHIDFFAGTGIYLSKYTTTFDGTLIECQGSAFSGDSGSFTYEVGAGLVFEGTGGVVTDLTTSGTVKIEFNGELDFSGDSGSGSVKLDNTEILSLVGGNGINTTAGGTTNTTAVDSTVCQTISGIAVGDGSANEFTLSAGDNITLTGTTGGLEIAADKYAIVASKKSGEYVALACVEGPETRFEDVVKIEVNERGAFEHDLDPEFVHVCEEDSIEAISYVCSEPSVAGIKVAGGQICVTFSHVTPLPNFITVKVSGIRAGRAGKRFVRFTEEEARNNAAFWNGWKG